MTLTGRVLRRLMLFRRAANGGAALELAVVFPVLLLLIIGAVDYGRIYFTSVTVANAARAGAEYGAQGVKTYNDTVGMKNFAKLDGAEAAGTLNVSVLRFCRCADVAHACSACSGGAAPDIYFQITATDTVGTLLPYPGLPTRIPISRQATFRSQ